MLVRREKRRGGDVAKSSVRTYSFAYKICTVYATSLFPETVVRFHHQLIVVVVFLSVITY